MNAATAQASPAVTFVRRHVWQAAPGAGGFVMQSAAHSVVQGSAAAQPQCANARPENVW